MDCDSGNTEYMGAILDHIAEYDKYKHQGGGQLWRCQQYGKVFGNAA